MRRNRLADGVERQRRGAPAVDVFLPADAVGGVIKSVDAASGSKALAGSRLASATIRLAPFAVAVVAYPDPATTAERL